MKYARLDGVEERKDEDFLRVRGYNKKKRRIGVHDAITKEVLWVYSFLNLVHDRDDYYLEAGQIYHGARGDGRESFQEDVLRRAEERNGKVRRGDDGGSVFSESDRGTDQSETVLKLSLRTVLRLPNTNPICRVKSMAHTRCLPPISL